MVANNVFFAAACVTLCLLWNRRCRVS